MYFDKCFKTLTSCFVKIEEYLGDFDKTLDTTYSAFHKISLCHFIWYENVTSVLIVSSKVAILFLSFHIISQQFYCGLISSSLLHIFLDNVL